MPDDAPTAEELAQAEEAARKLGMVCDCGGVRVGGVTKHTKGCERNGWPRSEEQASK